MVGTGAYSQFFSLLFFMHLCQLSSEKIVEPFSTVSFQSRILTPSTVTFPEFQGFFLEKTPKTQRFHGGFP